MKIEHLIKKAGHQKLLPIQKKCIEAYQENSELILLSKTGSGKTIAFLLSVISRIREDQDCIQAVIIAPTRELTQQIDQVFRSLKSGLKATLCYGGHSVKDEANSLKAIPELVIATPGRLLDHIERGNVNLIDCEALVIDEFDKCLEMGFDYEMGKITREFSKVENILLASATKPEDIPDYLNFDSPHVLDNLIEDDLINIEEFGVQYKRSVFNALVETVCSFGIEKSIVFCNYREVVEDVVQRLNGERIYSIGYHGGLDQGERERALIKFRNGSYNTLVCTDLGARGLDIPEIKHVVHYQYPNSLDAFVHRKGRTARMSEDGSSYLFIGPETQLPEYLEDPTDSFRPGEYLDTTPEWETLYFSAGKKEKVNKIDLVGFLSKKGQLGKGEIGLITVLDHTSYVAVKKSKVKNVLSLIRSERIKGKKLKIEVSM